MELKLKKELQEAYIYVPFINNNVLGKFINEGLYEHLYNIAPELFDIVEIPVESKTKKTKVIDDIFINNITEEGDITE
jgi:hypothetical protein